MCNHLVYVQMLSDWWLAHVLSRCSDVLQLFTLILRDPLGSCRALSWCSLMTMDLNFSNILRIRLTWHLQIIIYFLPWRHAFRQWRMRHLYCWNRWEECVQIQRDYVEYIKFQPNITSPSLSGQKLSSEPSYYQVLSQGILLYFLF